MRFSIIFVLLSFLSSSLLAQAVLLEADFNDCAVPSDWNVNLIGNQDAVWYVSDEITNENSDGNTIDGSCMLVFDDDATGNNTDDWSIQITTPAFDGTAFSTINFSVDVHFRQLDESYFRISVFDGTDFVQLANWQGGINTGTEFSEFVTFEADLSFYANENMQLRFEFDDGQTWAWWAGMDNVLVTGEGNAENIILSDFNSCSQPEDWFIQTFQGVDDFQFGISTEGNNSMNGSCFAYFDDDIIGEDAAFSQVALISPPFSGTDYADIFLDFDVILRRAVDEEHLGIYIFDGEEAVNIVNYFTDLGGPNFDEYIHERIDLSPFRKESMQVVFLYDDGDAWGWWVGIDNVKISGSGTLNDLCENAIDVSLNQECISGNNQNALFLGDQPSCNARNEGALWYKYTASMTGIVELVTNANYNDLITVFTGNCAAQNELICYDRDEQGFTGENLFFDVVGGTEYYIRISGKNENFGVPRGNLCLELKSASTYPNSESNDACANALALTIDGNCLASNNIHADLDGDLPTLNTLSRADIWYTFTAGNEPIEILSNADFADVITVFAESCNGTEVASNDLGQKLRVENLNEGETYFLQISGFFSTVEGNVCAQIITISEEIPENNECFNAVNLAIGADCYAGNNIGATESEPRPGCETEYDASVWFEFIAPESGAVNMNTGADFVHAVSIYEGTCNALEEIYCTNNPLACGGYFKVGSLTPGETYFMQIASASNHLGLLETGNFCIDLIDGALMTAPALDLNVGVNCTGVGIGELQVAATGGTGNYTFQGNTNGQIMSTGENYLVIVTDDNGCEISVSGTANCGQADCSLTAEISSTDISCNGANNGSASVTTSNDVVSYLWSNGATTSQITQLTQGIYTVTVTDELACSSVQNVTIYEPASLENNLSATNETGYQANDGTVNANPTGGSNPYTYLWSNGSTAASQNGLAPGTYTVTVTDANDCQTIENISISTFSCAVAADISSSNISCFGENNGTASVNFTSGTSPYTYLWSNESTTASIANLSMGIYTVTATDANDCPLILSVEISQPALLQANTTATGVTSAGGNDGTAMASPTGGTEPFEYLWSNDEVTSQINNLSPGNYTLTITDANDCENIETVTVNAFDCALSASISTEDVVCFGENNGTATVNINGGTSPYTYAWSSGGNEMIEENLSAGNYDVTITDGADCPAVISFVITAPDALGMTIVSQTNLSCSEDTNANLTVMGQGGTGAYEYEWSSGSNTNTASTLSAGFETVTITDGNNCTYIEEIEILVEDNINPIVSTQDVIVNLNAAGVANISISDVDNGSNDNCGEITFNLNQTTFDCDDLGENTLTLIVTDAIGNESSATATVNVIDEIEPEISCPQNIIAPCDGYVEYEAPTATDNCSINTLVLTEGLGSGNTFPAGTTTETYIAIDIAGNETMCSFTIEVSNPLMTEVEIEKPTCNGDQDGSATVIATGSTGLTYQWNDPLNQTTASAQNLAAGTYEVIVTDENDCSITQVVVVPEPPVLNIDIVEVINDNNNLGNGSITVNVTGGEQPYTYEWTLNGAFFSNETNLTNLSLGTYQVQITDNNDCLISSESIIVDSETSTNEVAIAQYFEVFPNPTSGKFFVQIGLPQAKNINITLYDVAGKKIEVRDLTRIQNQLLSFDLIPFASGVYELRAIVGDEVVVFKLVKI